MALRPLGKAFLFQFVNETYGGKFVERNKGSIFLTNQDLTDQAKVARWGKIVAVGSEVEDLHVDQLVLIEALQWTKEYQWEKVRYWKSDESKVMATTTDESVTYAF